MRAPFRIAEGFDLADIDERLARFAASRPVVTLPEMALRRLGPFFALVPATPSESLATLATRSRANTPAGLAAPKPSCNPALGSACWTGAGLGLQNR